MSNKPQDLNDILKEEESNDDVTELFSDIECDYDSEKEESTDGEPSESALDEIEAETFDDTDELFSQDGQDQSVVRRA